MVIENNVSRTESSWSLDKTV